MKNQNEDMGFQIIVNSPGNYIAKEMNFDIKGDFIAGTNPLKNYTFTDKQMSEALKNCVGKGKVVNAKWKWIGPYWYLRWAHKYPVDPQAFCEKINNLPGASSFEIQCDYENIRKYVSYEFINQDARYLDSITYPKKEEQLYKQCLEIRKTIIEMLRKTISADI